MDVISSVLACVHFLCNNSLSWTSVMMQQSKLTHLQRKKINESLKSKSETFGWGVNGCNVVINCILYSTNNSLYVAVPHKILPILSYTGGAASPPTSEHTSPAPPTNPKTTKYVPNSLPCKPQRRSAEACRSGNTYVREQYHPGPSSVFFKLTTLLIRRSYVATGLQ